MTKAKLTTTFGFRLFSRVEKKCLSSRLYGLVIREAVAGFHVYSKCFDFNSHYSNQPTQNQGIMYSSKPLENTQVAYVKSNIDTALDKIPLLFCIT